jgi:glyoxylase-like metal-dependent hydrolase (beta-lactamase superfamily II)
MAAAGLAEWQQRSPQEADLIQQFQPAEGRLPDGIALWPSPGHTLGHHALLVDSQWGKLIVAGDAVMTEGFFQAEEGFHNSVDLAQARDTIRLIKCSAGLVIPGHGNLIVNTSAATTRYGPRESWT